MSNLSSTSLFDFWRTHNCAPFHFPMSESQWCDSMYRDVDSDGRTLFSDLITDQICQHGKCTAMIQYGHTAFGFDEAGEISANVQYPVIRCLCFDDPRDGETLLQDALNHFGSDKRVYAFFHYFGLSVCGRHGKLHENDTHVADLLKKNGFQVEHENVYYSRRLTGQVSSCVQIQWKPLSPGGCREFAAILDGAEFCWGQVHFLPQKDIAYLRWIYVDESKQHQGFGSQAMNLLFSELYQMGIRRFDTDTALNNLPAQHFYEKNGFTNEGMTRSYYTK